MHPLDEPDDPLLEILLIQRLIRIGPVIRVSAPNYSIVDGVVLLHEVRQAPLDVRPVTNRRLPVIAFDVPDVGLDHTWIDEIADVEIVLCPGGGCALFPGVILASAILVIVRIGVRNSLIALSLGGQPALPTSAVILFMNCPVGQSHPATAVAVVSEISHGFRGHGKHSIPPVGPLVLFRNTRAIAAAGRVRNRGVTKRTVIAAEITNRRDLSVAVAIFKG